MLRVAEDIPHDLMSALKSTLRICDDAIVLPTQAHRSEESGAFKNVVMRINGAEPNMNPDAFSSDWFGGVSVLKVPIEVAEPLLKDPGRRATVLKKLAKRIPSELHDADIQVGPELECDESDRDTKPWIAGFDSPACCVGLYSAKQLRAPEAGLSGMNRAHEAYYLVCKAGGGVAAQTFHARLCSALRKGMCLDKALEDGNEPGPQALRRVSLAAQRNRHRILTVAAEVLGYHTVDTIGDNAASPSHPYRGAVTLIDVVTNSLRKEEVSVSGANRSMWQYSAGCIDAQLSNGLVTASNVAEGFVAFTNSQDEFRMMLRNGAHNCLPFTTLRLRSNRSVATEIAAKHKEGRAKGNIKVHPDHDWVRERFVWTSKDFGNATLNLEPVSVWGTHASESFLACWARELGVATFKSVRMAPEIVCISGMEQSKLRAAVKHVTG